MKDIHGKAIVDFYQGKEKTPLNLYTSYGEIEEMPVEVFFRDEEDLSVIDHLALIECKGKVLDIGAGTGVHALILEGRGFDVFALEKSPGCVKVMTQSGVSNIIQEDFNTHNGKYDTLIVLMNGLGIAGTLEGIKPMLEQFMTMLNEGGQILADSSDLSYLYEMDVPRPTSYYGEIRYQYEYDGEKGEWFDWVYIDKETLKRIVEEIGLDMEILHTDEDDQYLVRITGQ